METTIPTVSFSTIDYGIMAIYLLGLLAMGWHFRRFANESLENYYLGGRKLKGWMSGTSYAVTCMNADVAPAYCGMTVITGVWIYWWYLSRFGLALMIGAVLFAIFWRRLQLFTSPAFYEKRFNGAPASLMRSWIALRSAFIAVVAWTGAGLLGMTKVTEGLLGWERWETMGLFLPVLIIYVLLSGYMGVIVSDLIQTVILILSSLVLMALVWIDFGGPTGLLGALQTQFGDSVTQWHPPSQHELLGITGVLVWTIGTAIGYGGDLAPMSGAMEGQRLLSCKNGWEAVKMYLWTLVVLFLMLSLLTLPALGAMLHWPGLHDGSINKELAFGMLLGHYLPAGLLGLAFIAMLASIMSTVDSNMNFGAQVFLHDIYQRFLRPDASMRHLMRIGKWVMMIILALALWVATAAENVIDIAVFMLGLSSAELTANWGQWWWWRFNGQARLAASFGGPLLFLFNEFVLFRWLIDAGPDSTYLVILSSIAMTTVLWIIVALRTEPEPEEKLIAFYREARPLGWWGPIARACGEAPEPSGLLRQGFGIALAGFVMLAAATIGLSHFYIGRWDVAGIAIVVALGSGWWLRKHLRPYIRGMQER